jgi:hypothetical protein
LFSRVRLETIVVTGLVAVIFSVVSCATVKQVWVTKGVKALRTPEIAPTPPTRMIIFALDGAGYNQFMAAVRSGDAPNIAGVLGREGAGGLFEHAYAAPNALSMLPSSTVADWSAVFTGDPPAWDGVTGDEWFERRQMAFHAPVPISTRDLTDLNRAIADDLIGRQLRVPTLYELLGVDSYVSLMFVYRGANIYTTVGPLTIFDVFSDFLRAKVEDKQPERTVAASVDRNSIPKLIDAIERYGVPNLQVVYFPGIDAYTHGSPHPLEAQTRYIERVTDPLVGQVLDEYRKKNALDGTYIVFIADHGHIPTISDDRHALGTGPDSPFGVVNDMGFRVRPPQVDVSARQEDFQAVLGYQGFMAYIYLADRSTCPNRGEQCDWSRPPRVKEDLMPVLRAIYRANRPGSRYPRLVGSIDLIFSRPPAVPGHVAPPFEIFDGRRLVPIPEYLRRHPRPDLIELDRRMKWLGFGKYGDRAGDIVLLARTGSAVPIEHRYYFAVVPHYSWHGSASALDSDITFVLAREGGSGASMRRIVKQTAINDGDNDGYIYEKDLTPMVRAIFHR